MQDDGGRTILVEALVSAERVCKSFGPRQALSDLTFSIPSGRVCGLLGPNGAGKTTLFRLRSGSR